LLPLKVAHKDFIGIVLGLREIVVDNKLLKESLTHFTYAVLKYSYIC